MLAMKPYTKAQEWLAKRRGETLMRHPNDLRNDTLGAAPGMNVGAWIVAVILVTILVIVLAALMPTYVDALSDYDNASTDPIAPILKTLGPILLSVAVLLVLVFAFLPSRKGR